MAESIRDITQKALNIVFSMFYRVIVMQWVLVCPKIADNAITSSNMEIPFYFLNLWT